MIEKLNFKRKNLKPKLSDKEMVEIKRRVQEEISMYSVNSILQGWTTNIRNAENVDRGSESYRNNHENMEGKIEANKLLNNHEVWTMGGIRFPLVIIRRITRDCLASLESRRGFFYILDGLTHRTSDYFTKNIAHVRSGFPCRVICTQDQTSFATITIGGRCLSIKGLRSLYYGPTKRKNKGKKEKFIEELIGSSNQKPPHSMETQQQAFWNTLDAVTVQQRRQDVAGIDVDKLTTIKDNIAAPIYGDGSHTNIGVHDNASSSNSADNDITGEMRKRTVSSN